ncbi:MAG: hypothetical protein ACKO1U_09070 [Bacteroidota bacterium]
MKKDSPQLILNVSGNLLGFCLIVITSLHMSSRSEARFLDGLMLMVTVLLTSASVFSFVAIKKEGNPVSIHMTRWSEYFFFASLLGILIATVLVTLNFME